LGEDIFLPLALMAFPRIRPDPDILGEKGDRFSVVLSMSRDFLFLREKVACPLFLFPCMVKAVW
jgi:hypothetical protein